MTVYDDLLVADFHDCFEQMRHYEEGFLKRLEFGFGGMLAVIGAAAFLIEHFKATAFTLGAVGLLLVVSGGVGCLLVFSLARNRVYFAFVARYVNEIRALYLSKHPEGLTNKSGMYSDHRYPKIFDPGSSQSIDIYFLAVCVSLLLGGAVTSLDLSYRVQIGTGLHINWAVAACTILGAAIAQLSLVIIYWRRKEQKKTAHGAVHGKPELKSNKPSTEKS
jgi:hypothetical protein